MDGRMTMGDLRGAIAPHTDGGDQTTEQLGRAFLNGLLGGLANGMMPGQGGGVSQVKELLGAVKDVDDIQDRREKRRRDRLEDELEELRDDIRALMRRGKGMGTDDGMGSLVSMVIDSNNKAWSAMMDKQSTEMQAILERVAEKMGGSDMQQWLTGLGRDYLQGAISRDPKKEYETEKSYWESRLGDHHDRDWDQWYAKEKLRLEEKQIDSQMAQEVAEREQRVSGLQSLAEVAAALMGRTPGAAGATSPDTGTPGGIYRYECPSCHHDWLQRTLESEFICPKCGQHAVEAVTIEGDHGAA